MKAIPMHRTSTAPEIAVGTIHTGRELTIRSMLFDTTVVADAVGGTVVVVAVAAAVVDDVGVMLVLVAIVLSVALSDF